MLTVDKPDAASAIFARSAEFSGLKPAKNEASPVDSAAAAACRALCSE